jgi:6-phosphofructokinase 1
MITENNVMASDAAVMPRDALLVAHSGGPTAVLNASLAGVVDEARRHPAIGACYGARFGIEGMCEDDLVDLGRLAGGAMAGLADQSGSVLGTSRKAVSPDDLDRALAVCRRRAVRFVLYTGGNGSMGTARELADRAHAAGQPLSVIGVPKTIDNDLAVTDHSPGYGSAARFFAAAARDIGADNRALRGLVQFVEVLGRHAGWLVAATTLARRDEHDAPHLVYCPERPLPLERLLGDVQRVFDRHRRCVVAICEGQLDEKGAPFGADVRMSSRGPLATNLAHRLANVVTEQLGLKARGEKPGLLGRVSRELRSEVDWQEARLCGEAAVRAALAGESGVMITLDRQPGAAYACTTGRARLADVAHVERTLPGSWIAANGHDITPEFERWSRPLVGSITTYD